MIGHRGKGMEDLIARIEPDLQYVFRTKRPVYIASSSATGLMEGAIRNGVRARVLCLVNGAFSERFFQIARACGVEAEALTVPLGQVHSPEMLDAALKGGKFDAITVVHSETSTGALNPIAELTRVAHAAGDVAVLVDVFCRALERAGAASEVLGFTTGAWHGGRAQKAWLRAGRPARPGRLNERLHVVFKAFETTWRRGRAGIAALLHGEHFREGLDGEALAWAATRLLARPARRRLLVVVSDGSPTDGATALANGPDYLERHLHEVAGAIERGGAIELHALGVGLDLGAWYASSHLLDLDARIGNAMFAEVLALLGRRRRPS